MAADKSNREWFIYILKCPKSGEVRYVGWTFDVKKRVSDHRYTAKKYNRYRDCWIRSLMKEGLFPTHYVIDSGFGDSWRESERKWIAHYRGLGCRLTNLTDGGEGVPGLVHSEESKEKNRRSKIGKRHSAETIQKMRLMRISHPTSESTKEKISKSNTGKIRTEEQRKRNSDAHRGKTGKKYTAEERVAASVRLRLLYADHPEKHGGRKPSDITNQKFGRLIAIRCVGSAKSLGRGRSKHSIWLCICQCGRNVEVAATSLKTGASKSCGCLRRELTIARNRLGKCD